MNRQPVNSSNLKSVGYDQNQEILEIEFQSWRVYQYLNVPAAVYSELINANSLGQYFNNFIKDYYPTIRIS